MEEDIGDTHELSESPLPPAPVNAQREQGPTGGAGATEPEGGSGAVDDAHDWNNSGLERTPEVGISTPRADSSIDCNTDPDPPPSGDSNQQGNQFIVRGEKSKCRLFPTEKRNHQPSRETPYPEVKVQLVQVAVPGTDRDPHSGYDPCVPKRQGKHKHWVPRHMHVPAGGGTSGERNETTVEANQEEGPEQWLPGEGGDHCWVVAGLGTADDQQVVGPDGGCAKSDS